ncbi:MAG TPA: methyltransferase domain-containing protein [Vicinamibacteria bacterium]
MDLNTNSWNRARYTLWAPLYDLAGKRFDGRRRASLQLLDLKPRERLLIVGAGTGAELPHVPAGVSVVATDITPAMLRRGRRHLRPGASLALMDGHRLGVGEGTIDAVTLHLILAVIPDPARCLQEVARVLRPGGRAAVFDKFVRTTKPSLGLRALNLLTAPLFTEVTRCFEEILERSGAPLKVERDFPAWSDGLFRHLILRKTS